MKQRFADLLNRHIHNLTIRYPRAWGLCPFHEDRHPSFSADFEKSVWYCFPCGRGGGVKEFAELLGESWAIASLLRQERRRVAASLRQREAKQKACALLRQREEERLDKIFSEWREVNRDAAHAAELLSLFQRRPDLAEEFSDLAERAEYEYSQSVFKRSLLEARIDQEVSA
jgi:DNA primase